MYIIDPETSSDKITKLNDAVGKLIKKEGGEVVRMDEIGMKTMAYPIQKKTEGHYVLFEIEGSGQEIAELERRMRVNDMIMRYITVRVDEDRKKRPSFGQNARRVPRSVPGSARRPKRRRQRPKHSSEFQL